MTTAFQADGRLGPEDEHIKFDLPWGNVTDLRDSSYSFSSNEEEVGSWGSRIAHAESGHTSTEVVMFTPAFHLPTRLSISHCVDPGVLLAQRRLHGAFISWPAIHPQQPESALITLAQAHQGPGQQIAEK
jgi:hypothetical protein